MKDWRDQAMNRDISIDLESLAILDELDTSPNRSLMSEVIETYLLTTPPLVENLKESFGTKDNELMLNAIHAIKTSSSSIGAFRLAKICLSIEEYLSSTVNNEVLKKGIMEVEAESHKVRQDLILIHILYRQYNKHN